MKLWFQAKITQLFMGVRHKQISDKLVRVTAPARSERILEQAIANTMADAWRQGKVATVTKERGLTVLRVDDMTIEFKVVAKR